MMAAFSKEMEVFSNAVAIGDQVVTEVAVVDEVNGGGNRDSESTGQPRGGYNQRRNWVSDDTATINSNLIFSFFNSNYRRIERRKCTRAGY